MTHWLVIMSLACSPLGAETFSHDRLDRVLQTFVDPQGRVDYAALKAKPGDLNAYVDQLRAKSPDNAPDLFPSRDHQLAYWINAYNALVLKGVIGYYPIRSVKDVKWFYGFFKRDTHVVGGQTLTLDHIEHGIIRPRFKDPRIHFAVNCASISCPRLAQKAFTAQTLQADLDRLTREFVASPQQVRIEGQTLWVSPILDWYREDFGDGIAFLSRYASSEQAEKMKGKTIQFMDYDWNLNGR